MPKFMVTLTGATSMGSIVQCAALTAKLNGKPIATVGDVATYPQASDVLVEGVPGILLNGKPIVCSGGKTAMGACVMPNTCVKVSTTRRQCLSFTSRTTSMPSSRFSLTSLNLR
ncbi:MAG: PAAR domain-containing protein [Paludibacteraceae bacterium]|nr:PAAR domain-containing protein [Paludibacteraceae bacterium]